MVKETTIIFNGKKVLAEEMEFKAINENWNEYETEDGSRIKIKLVCAKILRLKDKYDKEGNPIYRLLSANVATVESPNKIKEK